MKSTKVSNASYVYFKVDFCIVIPFFTHNLTLSNRVVQCSTLVVLCTHMKGGCIVESQRECCHYAAEHHDEGDDAQHREALQLEGVALVEAFQLIVLKAQRVERAAARRLDGMVHAAAVAAAAPSAAASSCLGVPSSRAVIETQREREGG